MKKKSVNRGWKINCSGYSLKGHTWVLLSHSTNRRTNLYYEVHPYDVVITIYFYKQCLSTVKCVVLISSVTMYASYDCNQ